MNVSDIYPRRWLRVEDLFPGRVYRARIAGAEIREGWWGRKLVLLLHPPGVSGRVEIFLSRSAAWGLAAGLGEEIEGWVGKEIVVSRGKIRGKETIQIATSKEGGYGRAKSDTHHASGD